MWLALALVGMVSCSMASAAFIGPFGAGNQTPGGGGASGQPWTGGEGGDWYSCSAGTSEPNSATCLGGSYEEGDATVACDGACWAWPFADGPSPPLPATDPNPQDPPPDGGTADPELFTQQAASSALAYGLLVLIFGVGYSGGRTR